eukprot:4303303-Amphidinium_carterae.2
MEANKKMVNCHATGYGHIWMKHAHSLMDLLRTMGSVDELTDKLLRSANMSGTMSIKRLVRGKVYTGEDPDPRLG